jgi:pimeloyl-ACP methyl ester carboxylesterase
MKLTVDGREVFAYTGGKPFDPALPCVVFLHGAMGDHGVWTLLARWFAHHGHGVLAFDLPGHMRSAGPALPSIEAMAAWLWQALTAAGVQRASAPRCRCRCRRRCWSWARATHRRRSTAS